MDFMIVAVDEKDNGNIRVDELADRFDGKADGADDDAVVAPADDVAYKLRGVPAFAEGNDVTEIIGVFSNSPRSRLKCSVIWSVMKMI